MYDGSPYIHIDGSLLIKGLSLVLRVGVPLFASDVTLRSLR